MTREQLEDLAQETWDNADATPHKSRWDSALETLEDELIELGQATVETANAEAESLLRDVIGSEHENVIDPRQC